MDSNLAAFDSRIAAPERRFSTILQLVQQACGEMEALKQM